MFQESLSFLNNTILAVFFFSTEITNVPTCGKAINFIMDKIGFDSLECWLLLMRSGSLFRDEMGFANSKTKDFLTATN